MLLNRISGFLTVSALAGSMLVGCTDGVIRSDADEESLGQTSAALQGPGSPGHGNPGHPGRGNPGPGHPGGGPGQCGCNDPAQQRLEDIRALTELTYRYAYALDDRDWTTLRSLFVPNARFDYGLGPEYVMFGRDVFVDATAAALAPMDATHHMFTNHVFDIDGNTATGRFYMHAQHMKLSEQAGPFHTLGGYYREKFVRTNDGWKISEVIYTATWGRGNPAVNPGFRTDAP